MHTYTINYKSNYFILFYVFLNSIDVCFVILFILAQLQIYFKDVIFLNAMKKKLLTLSFSLILGIMLGFSQTKDPYSFSLNGNKISPQPNFQQAKKLIKVQNISKKADEIDYLILQFDQIPNKEEKEKLKKEGLILLNYLQGNAYYAAVSQKFYDITRSASRSIRAVVPIKPEYKIAENLLSGDIPSYAKGYKNKIKIVISYFYNADVAEVKKKITEILKATPYSIDEKFRVIQTDASKEEIIDLAALPWVANIEMILPPAEFNNKEGVNLHRSNILNSQLRGLGYGLTGKGVTLGLWDADVENHRDLVTRLKVKEYEMHTTDHGTHTAGTIGSAGLLDPHTRGMAPEVNIVSWNFNMQSNGLYNYQEREKSILEDGIELTSNSFGMRVTTCPNPYAYNLTDANEDLLAYKYPTFLFIYSAGNDQTTCSNGFYTTSKNIKNSLVVAAVNRQSLMSSFSSFGPSKDGRLIPNISGDGVDVYSTFFNNSYGYMDGTSMATPGVAGTMALLYQRYKQTNGNQRPTSALLRGIACNTATDLGNPGPDYKFGYGAINGLRGVQVVENKSYVEATVEQGKSFSKEITVPTGASALKVMLSWTDNYGMPGTAKALTNNIDLKVSNGGNTYLPWVLDPANPNSVATRGVDELNNLEQVTISNPQAGTYTITVDGTEIPDGAQDFAVIYDIVMPYITLTYPIGGESLVPKAEEVIHWNSEGYNGNFMIEYSEDGGTNYKVIASNIPNNQRSFLWIVPENLNTSKGKIRVSCGTRFSESKEAFNIMPTPVNIKLAELGCGGNGTTLTWDPVTNAKYEVLKLKGEVYEHLADVSTNSYAIANLQPSNDNYFAVKAIDLTTGAVSERSLAVTVNPATKVNELPIKENFENQSAPNFTFTSNNGTSSVKFVNTSQEYGIRLEGPNSPIVPAWDATFTTPEECFTKNAAYITKANICNLNASNLAGKQMFLKFDFRQKFRTATGTSFFRVKVNGTPVASIDGSQIYGATSTISYKTAYYDLTSLAGNSAITIEFEAVCKTNYTTYLNASGNYDFSNDSYDKGDFVNIDNVELYEPPKDIALTDLTISNGGTSAETVTIKVKNLSGNSIASIPVSYQLDNNTAVQEIIAGPINSFSEATYSFNQKIDLTAEGIHEIKGQTSLDGDPVAENNAKSLKVAVDLSNKMTAGTATITGCGLTISDAGGKYLDYPISTTSTRTLKPDVANKNIKITFTEFALEKGYDFLYIYDGPSTTSPLLGKFDGNSLPPTFTSTAAGGELTLKFTSDSEANDKGFIATTECVDKVNVDLALTAINKPTPTTGIKTSAEEINFTVKNLGLQAISGFDAFYQINENEPVKETLASSLAPGASATLSFTNKVDLSAPGTYTLKVWTKVAEDAVATNDAASIEITALPSTSDVGITAISPIVPARTNLSIVAATIQNYGTLPVSNFNVAYSINGGAEVLQPVAGPINPGATALVTFATKADFTAVQPYKLDVYTKLSGDATSANDKMSIQIARGADATTNVASNYLTGNTIATGALTNKFSLTNNFTVEYWMKPERNPKYGTMFSKGFSIIEHSEYYPAAYNTNCLLLSIGGQLFMSPNNSIEYGVWQHVAVTSAADGTIKLYINGVQQPLSNNAKVTQASNLTSPVRIGSNSNYSQPYYGAIDEVRIWNSERNQATISSNMMTDYPANTAGLYAYYKFKEGSNEFVYDYSANDNTATVLNGDVSGTADGKFWSTPGNLLSDVSFIGEKVATEYDNNTQTFKGIMPENATLSAIVANYKSPQLSTVKVGSTAQISGVTANDFSSNSTIDYTVEGIGFNNGISQTYHLNVTKDLSSECTLSAYAFDAAANSLPANIVLEQNGSKFFKKVPNTDASALKANFTVSPNAKVMLNDVAQTNPQSVATDYTKPLLAQVVSENGRFFSNYLIDLDARSNMAELTAFSIPEYQVGVTTFDQSNHTANIWVKNSTNTKLLTPAFSISPKAALFVGPIQQKSSATTNNFAAPVKYTVVSEDEAVAVDWTVTVTIDNVKPTITLKGASSLTVAAGSAYTDLGATATDNVDGDISAKITTTGSVNTNTLGTYTITYNVTDAAGNAAEAVTRTITVTDQTKPVITLLGDKTINTTYGATFTDPGVSATDNIDGNIAGKVTVTGTVNTAVIGTYTLTYNVSDAAGNAADAVTRTVIVGKATAAITISNTTQVFDAQEKSVTVTTTPANLKVAVTYNGSTQKPVGTGSYEVVATITGEANYEGSAKATLQINLGNTVKPEEANTAYIYANAGTIFVNIKEIKRSASIKIFTESGNCVYNSETMNIGMNQIKKSFNSGLYIVNLTVDGVTFKKKVVIVN